MKELVIEEFNSLGQYISVIGKRKTNKLFSTREELGSQRENENYYKTKSYDESVMLATNGYKEGLDSLTRGVINFQHKENAVKNMSSVDFVGHAPLVANAIAGVPKSMVSIRAIENKAKVITILYSHGDTAGVNGDSFIKAGKNILNVIYQLELKGYRVALYVMFAACKYQVAINIVQIKNWRQPSNPLKIAYPLLHPSYFRRQGFRWLETHPDIEDKKFLGGYGAPLRAKTSNQRNYLAEIKVLKQGWFYTYFNEALDNEPSELIKLIGIK